MVPVFLRHLPHWVQYPLRSEDHVHIRMNTSVLWCILFSFCKTIWLISTAIYAASIIDQVVNITGIWWTSHHLSFTTLKDTCYLIPVSQVGSHRGQVICPRSCKLVNLSWMHHSLITKAHVPTLSSFELSSYSSFKIQLEVISAGSFSNTSRQTGCCLYLSIMLCIFVSRNTILVIGQGGAIKKYTQSPFRLFVVVVQSLGEY